MDALEAIMTRTTVPQARMGPPGPNPTQLRLILEAGGAAPDHGRLRPWRFLVVQGAARERLGELFVQPLLARGGVSEGEIDKQRTSPLRAPVILVVVAKIQPNHPKIPEAEQLASAAAAAQNMLLAAHAMGFAGKWSTGLNAYDPTICAGLGLGPTDRITGFLFLGSCALPLEPMLRQPVDDVVVEWQGEGST